MATARLFLDTSAPHADGTSPVKIILSDKKKVSKITTGIRILPTQWNPKTCKVLAHPTAKRINDLLTEKLCEAQLTMLEGQRSAVQLSPREVRAEIQPTEDARPTLLDVLKDKSLDRRFSERTREIYKDTYNKVREYQKYKGYGRLVWEDIKPRWLDGFDRWMMETGTKEVNSRSIYLRDIRAAFNTALSDELTTYYPFRHFKIKSEKTRKRNIEVERLRQLLFGPVAPWAEVHQKFARLIFFLRGINIKDLCYLKKDDITGDYIEYKRAKSKRIYKIKIEPETRALIDDLKEPVGEYLFPMVKRYKNYKTYIAKINHALKCIGPWRYVSRGKIEYEPVAANASSYWLRYSWATIGIDLDIPKETISEGMGHEIGSSITSIYINFDQKKVDRANRKIMNYVLNASHSEATEVTPEGFLDSTDC